MIENDDRKLVLEYFRICVLDLTDLTVLLLWYEDFKKISKQNQKMTKRRLSGPLSLSEKLHLTLSRSYFK